MSPHGFLPALLLLGCVMLVLPLGCDSTPGEDYQPFSASDAEHVEQVREARAEQQAEEQRARAEEAVDATPIVLAAADNAAEAARNAVLTETSTEDQPDEQIDDATERPTAAMRIAAERFAATATPAEVAAKKAAEAVDLEPVVRPIKLLVPERSFTVEGPDDAIRISYDDFDLLKILNMDPVPPNAVSYFPKWLSDLDGKRVRVRGFMYPTFQETGIPAFTLARDNQICCFGRNPKIYDLVEVTLADGVTTDYIQGRPFDVVGTFRIRPEADGEQLWQLYQLDDAIVIDE